MMLSRKIVLASLLSMSLVAFSAIAANQRQQLAEPDATLNQPVQPMGMYHRARMGSGMMQMQMQMASEFDYLSQMIPHHQEAINTARIVLEQSDRPEMKAFAQNIIEVQSAEIAQMQAWLNVWYPDQQSPLVYSPMMRELNPLSGDELDQAFLEDMIHHHHMAVMMSRMLVNHELVEHEAVRPFAEQIATSQMNEIHQMQSWLSEWFNLTGMMHRHGMGSMH